MLLFPGITSKHAAAIFNRLLRKLGNESRKIHPKLRLFANSSPEVNTYRAAQAAALRIELATPLSRLPILRSEDAVALSLAELPAAPLMPPLQELAEAVEVNVFIQTRMPAKTCPSYYKTRPTGQT